MDLTVAELFEHRARWSRDAVAVEQDGATLSYGELAMRVARAAGALARLDPAGLRRFAILSENRAEFLEAQLAAAHLGATLACQNWRLAPPELQHCLDLVEPSALLVSPRMAERLAGVKLGAIRVVVFGAEWEGLCANATPLPCAATPDAPWLLLYTGGTTGLPKAAMLSQRVEIARMAAMAADLGMRPGDPCLAWPPLFHMGGTEPALHTLLTGGRVLLENGFRPDRLAAHLARTRFGWVSVMPGAVAALAAAVEEVGHVVGVGSCGVMADLVAPADLARLTRLLAAPWCNSFGSTETGTPPLSAARVAPGDDAPDLGKSPSPFCVFRLLDPDGGEVKPGDVGEIAVRGPTVFDGYWRDPAPRADWFRMGDLFRARPDGKFDFVDRAKYLIKSGGENIYPAEIERVLLSHFSVAEAIVVRQRDAQWGEVPVALVASRAEAAQPHVLAGLCRERLAGYKQPKRIIVVPEALLARTQTGKLPREALEKWVAAGSTPAETDGNLARSVAS